MKVMLFGGSFNPPHLGHQQMTTAVLKAQLADQLWYLPVGIHDFAKPMVAAQHRYQMLKLVLPQLGSQYFGRMRVEDCELRRSGVSHTADTLDYLSARYPQHQFSFLLGSDNLAKLHLWSDQKGRDFHYLLDHYQVFVYPRAGYPFKPFYPALIALTDLPEVEIASSTVRQLLLERTDFRQLTEWLDPAVIDYIKQERLYASKGLNND